MVRQLNAHAVVGGLTWLHCVMRPKINGLTGLVLTKFDVLDHLDEIRICIAYQRHGEAVSTFPSSLRVLEECEPIYETLPGWQQSTADLRQYEDLAPNAKRYIEYVSEFLDVPIVMISVGRQRTQTVMCDENFFSPE